MSAPEEESCKATRAVDVMNAAESLREEAAALTDDVNAAYYLVHETVSRALAEPGCAEVSADDLARDLSERFAEHGDDGPGTA